MSIIKTEAMTAQIIKKMIVSADTKAICTSVFLGITALISNTTCAVSAPPAKAETPQIIAQLGLNGGLPTNNLNGGIPYNSGGINQGRFTYPGGGSFYRGYLNNNGNGNYQGSLYRGSSIYQGTFYNPTLGGNFNGLFYDPGSGRIIQGNFYNPGTGNIDQNVYYNPIPPGNIYSGSRYNYYPELRCSDERNVRDWGLGCYSQQDYKRAIEYYSQVIRKNPQQANAYNQRALARFILGDRQGTIADLRKAASLYLAQGDKKRYQQTLITTRDIQSGQASGTKTK